MKSTTLKTGSEVPARRTWTRRPRPSSLSSSLGLLRISGSFVQTVAVLSGREKGLQYQFNIKHLALSLEELCFSSWSQEVKKRTLIPSNPVLQSLGDFYWEPLCNSSISHLLKNFYLVTIFAILEMPQPPFFFVLSFLTFLTSPQSRINISWGPRGVLWHMLYIAVPRKPKKAETKTVEEVDVQPSSRQELVFTSHHHRLLLSSSAPLVFHSSATAASPHLFQVLLIEVSDQKINCWHQQEKAVCLWMLPSHDPHSPTLIFMVVFILFAALCSLPFYLPLCNPALFIFILTRRTLLVLWLRSLFIYFFKLCTAASAKTLCKLCF